MSSFDFAEFVGDDKVFAVSQSRYTEEEADELFVRETQMFLTKARKITGWVYYALGFNANGERAHGYWFSETPAGRYPQKCWAYIYE